MFRTKKQNKKMIAKSIIEEISVSDLLKKLIDINKYYHVRAQIYFWGMNKYEMRKVIPQSKLKLLYIISLYAIYGSKVCVNIET